MKHSLRRLGKPFSIKHLGITLFIVCLMSCDANVGGSNSQNPDPVLVEFPVAYIERLVPTDELGERIPENLLIPDQFNPGAKLIFKDRAAVTAPELVLTEGVFEPLEGEEEALYDVKDLAVSSDGTKLLFAMHEPFDEDNATLPLPTWNIWQYDLETAELIRIIDEDFLAAEGHDIDPYFLPDGRIVFSSNRRQQSRSVLLDENRGPQFTPLVEEGDVNDEEQEVFNLHIIDPSDQTISQITFNESHDMQPTVISTGEILFVRWDNYVGGSRGRLSTYRINPDGSDLSLYYGYHSRDLLDQDSLPNDSVALTRPVMLADERLLFAQKPVESMNYGGDIVIADAQNFTDNTQATAQNEGDTGPAQESISFGQINVNDGISLGGYYNSAFPLNDDTNRLIVSYSFCLVDGYRIGIYLNQAGQLINTQGEFVDEEGDTLDSDETPVVPLENEIVTLPCTEEIVSLNENGNNVNQVSLADPAYGIWIYDADNQTQTPVSLAKADVMLVDAVVFENKIAPTDLPPPINDDRDQLISEGVGVVHIRSIYDVDGVDITPNGIEAMSDPAQTPVDDRPARFLRIVKAVSIPSEEIRDFDNSVFGVGARQMKDIIGYVAIEPDGSAKFKVPATVAFSLSVVDANGRRINDDVFDVDEPEDVDLGQRHSNWLSVTAGETKECVSCHTSSSTIAHGRTEAQRESAYAGASGAGFPNSTLRDSFGIAIGSGVELGQTMAEFYASELGPRTPTTGLEFSDEWSNDETLRGSDIFIRHASLTTENPESSGCQPFWTSLCRVVINYEEHIQPLWEAGRSITIDGISTDRTCISCHEENSFPLDAGGELLTQLELTSQLDAGSDYIRSYAQLFQAVVILEFDENGILAPRSAERVSLDEDGGILYEVDADGNFVLDAAGDRMPLTANAVCSVNDNNGITFIVRDDLGNIEYQTDGAGNFILDDEDFRIPRLDTITCTEPRRLGPNGSRTNTDFFDLFTPGSGVGIAHWDTDSAGENFIWLSDAELKLLSEWMDIGAQYYNNPFDAPADD